MANVLIIDDDRSICKTISSVVNSLGHECIVSFSLKEGIEKVRAGNIDVVFLDVRMPDGSGLKILPDILGTASSPEVIILTGYGDPDGAELAIKNGAWDYIEKPAALEKIKLPLIRALQYRDGLKSTKQPVSLKRGGILGNSQKIRMCLDILAKAAASDANGPSGHEGESVARKLESCFVRYRYARGLKVSQRRGNREGCRRLIEEIHKPTCQLATGLSQCSAVNMRKVGCDAAGGSIFGGELQVVGGRSIVTD